MTSDARRAAAPTTKARGDAAEAQALAHLLARGLVLLERNYRVARGPGARGGEVDLILPEADGTLVFVEVRRLVFAAAHFLRRFATPPPCRFDAVTIGGDRIEWLRAAFDAS